MSSQIAEVPLTLNLPDGSVVEIANTEANLADLERAGISTGVVAQLEANNRLLIGAVATTAALIVALAVWGIPALSKHLAMRLPSTLLVSASADSLAQLDRFIFKPTGLSPNEQAALSAQFARLLPEGSGAYQLQLRRSTAVGANAFALPNGMVVMTDELVGIAENPLEIEAVLLHEIGHLEHRHSLQMLLSHTGLATLAALVFGDVHAVGTLVVALPSVLMESSYSRQFETEADDFALLEMRKRQIPPTAFASMLEKLERCADVVPTKDQDFVSLCRQRLAKAKTTPAVIKTDAAPHGYFSTHPATAERIARFRRLPD
jgi:Zn-dependent protease with chaperone function